MTKLTVIVSLLATMACFSTFAQDVVLDDDFNSTAGWIFASGSWKNRDQSLVQMDSNQTIALASKRASQSGLVLYSFDLTFLSGLADGYAGVGIHICADEPAIGRSWGAGDSWLLWLTYDVKAYGNRTFFGQLYRSRGPVIMDMLHAPTRYPVSFARMPGDTPLELAGKTLTIRLQIDTATGRGFLHNPYQENIIYQFDLGGPLHPGNYIVFRTNSLSVSIDNLRVTRLPQ